MKRLLVLVFLTLLPGLAGAQMPTLQATTPAVRYGAIPTAGRTFTHDGVKLY